MPIFGQVWLWSLAAFLLGAVLTWALVVLPVRRRIDSLENRLSALRADAKLNAAAERSRAADPGDYGDYGDRGDRGAPAQTMVPGFDDLDSRDEIRAESLTRAYALPGVRDVPSTPYEPEPPRDPAERGALSLSPSEAVPDTPVGATQYLGNVGAPLAEPRPGDRDWFDDEPADGSDSRPDADEDDEDDDENRGTIFTVRTEPIPLEAIRQLTEAADRRDAPAGDHAEPDVEAEPEVEPEPEYAASEGAHALRATPSDEPAAAPETTEAEPVEPAAASNGLPKRTPSEVDSPARPQPMPMPMPMPMPVGRRSSVQEPPSRTENETRVTQAITVEGERSPGALPKRIPAKPQHRHPFGVQTVTPAVSLTEATEGGERIRSLFEPIVPAESAPVEEEPPPPNRLPVRQPGAARARGASTTTSAPGPFGPGSALPLPGGAAPSPEFTVKASVTALRYCTPESAQFGRTVAEVWFRSAADAERVGFRPVG